MNRSLRRVLAGLIVPAAVAAAPAPSPEPSASPAPSLVISCEHTPLYLWPAETSLPRRAPEHGANQGQRFAYLSSRATFDGTIFYETDIPVVEVAAGAHYWVVNTCAARI